MTANASFEASLIHYTQTEGSQRLLRECLVPTTACFDGLCVDLPSDIRGRPLFVHMVFPSVRAISSCAQIS
jgi:hypothetical protein